MLGAFMIIGALVVPGGGPADDKAKVLAGLQAWLDGTSTLDMRFRQSLVSSALGTTATESGRLYLERPGKLRWDYLDPEKKIALLLGDRTALYLEEERVMSRGRLSGDQGLFPRLLAGRERVGDFFTATLVATPSTGGRGAFRLRLVPKGGQGAMTEVTLTLRPPAFLIEGAELLDETGNRTTYTFSNVRRNLALPAGLFAFEPPPGTEVVDER
jgi:outer membrane lipoprotein carrier protein